MTKKVRQSALLPHIGLVLKINKITLKKLRHKSPHTIHCLHFNQEQKEKKMRADITWLDLKENDNPFQ